MLFLYMFCLFQYGIHVNKRYRIQKGKSKMDNPEKLETKVTQDEEKHNTVCAGHHYTQTNTYNVNKIR